MKFILGLILALPLSTMAAPRERSESDVLRQLNLTSRSLEHNIQKMSERDLREASELLLELRNLAEGQGRGGQRPPRVKACANDTSTIFQSTFTKIKSFAYSGIGLNLSSQAATQFATDWTNKYPCSLADKYERDTKRIVIFAYSGLGLNYTYSEARNFAIEKAPNFCSDYKLEEEFRRFYNFAYSTSGLNYSSTAAIAYALDKIERSAFSCRNF